MRVTGAAILKMQWRVVVFFHLLLHYTSHECCFFFFLLQIPPGIQTDQKIRLGGKGIARVNGYGYGDHYVHIKVKVPK